MGGITFECRMKWPMLGMAEVACSGVDESAARTAGRAAVRTASRGMRTLGGKRTRQRVGRRARARTRLGDRALGIGARGAVPYQHARGSDAADGRRRCERV